MEDNYPKAYKEVLEVLKYVPEESVSKIPKEMTEMFEINQDKEYNFEVDTTKNFDEQVLLDETKAILANIFIDYWTTPEQKEKIEAFDKNERRKIEEYKREKYNPDLIFKRNKIEDTEVNNLPTVIEKESFFKRIISFFKSFFKID